MSKYEVTTKVYKVDFKKLIDNALNRIYWGKKWVIFNYDKVKIYMELTSINITDNKLYLGISMESDKLITSSKFNTITLPLQKSHFNELALKRSLVGNIEKLLKDYEKVILRTYQGYLRSQEYDSLIEEEAERRAKDLLDSEGITNEAIREAYIASVVDNNYKAETYSFLSSGMYKTRPHYYLMLSAFFFPNNKEYYEKMELKTSINKKTKRYLLVSEDVKEYIKAVRNDEEYEYFEELDMDLEEIK